MASEDQLSEAMRTTAADLRPPADLVDRGIARGRGMRRRHALRVTAGAVATVTAVTAGAVVNASLLRDSPTGQVAADGPTVIKPIPLRTLPIGPAPRALGPQLPGPALAAILKRLLPPGRVITTASQGGDIEIIYADGKGASAISMTFRRVRPDDADAQCVPIQIHPYSVCTATTLPDGARLVIDKGYTRPQSATGEKLWTATLTRKNGAQIRLEEYNSAGHKSAAGVTREEPALPPAQLRAIVTSPEWDRVLDSIPEPAPEPTARPGGGRIGLDGDRIMRIMKSRLPQGVRTSAEHASEGTGMLLADDGRGRSMVDVSAQNGMWEAVSPITCAAQRQSPDIDTCTETTLPSGGLLRLTKGSGSKGGRGIVVYVADVVYPDGRRIAAHTANGISEAGPRTRATPVLTMERLRALVTDPAWKN